MLCASTRVIETGEGPCPPLNETEQDTGIVATKLSGAMDAPPVRRTRSAYDSIPAGVPTRSALPPGFTETDALDPHRQCLEDQAAQGGFFGCAAERIAKRSPLVPSSVLDDDWPPNPGDFHHDDEAFMPRWSGETLRQRPAPDSGMTPCMSPANSSHYNQPVTPTQSRDETGRATPATGEAWPMLGALFERVDSNLSSLSTILSRPRPD